MNDQDTLQFGATGKMHDPSECRVFLVSMNGPHARTVSLQETDALQQRSPKTSNPELGKAPVSPIPGPHKLG